MKLLKDRILKEGHCLSGNILKVDSFINHQIDPEFTMDMGKEFVRRFADVKIDKVLTIESSGIAIGMAVAYELKKASGFCPQESFAAHAGGYVYLSDCVLYQKGSQAGVRAEKVPAGRGKCPHHR